MQGHPKGESKPGQAGGELGSQDTRMSVWGRTTRPWGWVRGGSEAEGEQWGRGRDGSAWDRSLPQPRPGTTSTSDGSSRAWGYSPPGLAQNPHVCSIHVQGLGLLLAVTECSLLRAA